MLGIIALLVFNDFVYDVVEKMGEAETIYRFLWILPVTVLCGFLIIEIWGGLSKRIQKLAYILILAVAILTNYKLSFNGWVNWPENVYQISDEQIEVAQILKGLETKWRLKFWDDGTISDGLRQYDGRVMLEIDSSVDMDQILANQVINVAGSTMQAILCNEEIDVIGVKKENILTQTLLETAGCRLVGETKSSYIYYFKWREMNKRWKTLISYYNEAIVEINEEYITMDDLESTYEILYLTDMNIDLNNNEYVNANNVSSAEQLKAWIQMANQREIDAVLLGGNTLHSYSEQNVEFLKEQLAMLDMPYLYVAGDSDITSEDGAIVTAEKDPYGLFEVTDTRSQALNLKEFEIWAITKESYDEMSEIVDSDVPVILMTHIPFLYEDDTQVLNYYHDNKKNKVTELGGDLECILQDESAVVEILAGGVEEFDKSLLNDRVVQYVGNATYKGSGTLFVIRGD